MGFSPILIPGLNHTEILPGIHQVEILCVNDCSNGIGDLPHLGVKGLLKCLLDLVELGDAFCLDLLLGDLCLFVHNLGDLAIGNLDDLAILGGVVTIRCRIAVALLIGDVNCIPGFEILILIVPLKFALVGFNEIGFNLCLRFLDLGYLALYNNNHLVVIGLVVSIRSRSPVTLGVLNIDRITCLEILITIPGDDSLVCGDIAKLLQHLCKSSLEFGKFAHKCIWFENSFECTLQEVNYLLDLILVLFRHKVKDTLQGKSLVCSCLDLIPNGVIDHMEFTKQRSVCTIIKAIHLDAITLDEILHHLHTVHIRPLLMHEVDIILPPLQEIFLCHSPDGVRLIYDVIFPHLGIPPVDWEIRPHDASPDKSLFLILDGIEHGFPVCIKCLEIEHDCRVINQ